MVNFIYTRIRFWVWEEISLTKSFFHWVWTSHKVKNISKKTTRNHQGTISTKESDTMILIYESTLKQLKN